MNDGRRPIFSVCIPAYNSAGIIGETLESVFAQTVDDFEIVVVDDASTDATADIVRSFGDPRVRYERNLVNLGYARNVARCAALARGRYVYLLGNDDILSPVALERTLAAFELDADVALVTRPYFWFTADDPKDAVRHVPPLDSSRDAVVDIACDTAAYCAVLDSLGQLSGLAYRRDAMSFDFDSAIFTAHVQPFLVTWKGRRAVFLRDYVVAVRIVSSQTRSLSSIYDPSPVVTWVQMFERVFAEPQFRRQREAGRRHLAGHLEGLVQVRCYAPFRQFMREVGVLVRYRPQNLVRPLFWGIVVGLTVLPRAVVVRLVDRFKATVAGTRERGIALASRSDPPHAPLRASRRPSKIAT